MERHLEAMTDLELDAELESVRDRRAANEFNDDFSSYRRTDDMLQRRLQEVTAEITKRKLASVKL